MPKVTSVKRLDEECPDCNFSLVGIVEEFNPFPDDGGVQEFEVRFNRCGRCGYELVTFYGGDSPKETPFKRRVEKRTEEYSLTA